VSDASPAALAGKLALVTGASRGIGLAVAELLHAAGAHVVRLARSLVDGTADRRTDLRCDVTDPAAVERAVGRVLKDRGIPDIVVNNAGIFFIKAVAETTPDEFSRTLAVNLTAPFLVTRALVPHLVRRGAGHFVTIGSISDHVAFTGSTASARPSSRRARWTRRSGTRSTPMRGRDSRSAALCSRRGTWPRPSCLRSLGPRVSTSRRSACCRRSTHSEARCYTSPVAR